MKKTTQKPSEAKTSEVRNKTKSQRPLIPKPPVVVVLGHIDHGKSSLLQGIKELGVNITEKEAGGITQHIGAYQAEKDGRKITFIDTPGHEAFSAMRSRGAKVADIAVLVIDVAEGIRPQTKEAISHIKKAQIPFIVALNKIDKPEANPEKIKRELQKEGILVEDLGGKIPQVLTSAKTGQGIKELLELITLVAEIENLKADTQKSGEGVVIESYLDTQRGPTATLISSQGVLKAGDIVGTPTAAGKIKILESFQGKAIEKVLPAEPAIVVGFEAVPRVGENFKVFSNMEDAEAQFQIVKKAAVPSLNMGAEVDSGQRVLNLILKADVLGSIEAIEEVLEDLSQEKPSTRAELDTGLVPRQNEVSGTGLILRILKSEVGEVTESDVKLAKSIQGSKGALQRPVGQTLILGFRVKISPAAKQLAEREKIKIMGFEIIYDLVEEVRKFIGRITETEVAREDLGKLKVLAIFLTEKNRQIVGGKVIEGEIEKGAQAEVFRGEEFLGRGKVINLQRNKKDIEQIGKGEECGILYEGDVRIEEGDILSVFKESRRKGEL
jgi:translation initiation factor IF-2